MKYAAILLLFAQSIVTLTKDNVITLTAKPKAFTTFTGWSGIAACSEGYTCQITGAWFPQEQTGCLIGWTDYCQFVQIEAPQIPRELK